MSRARGNVLQNALATYLRTWWPHAESAGAGRNGTDVLGTPGVVWECKTAAKFSPSAFVAQARTHALCKCANLCAPGCDGETANLPVVVYYPPGLGEIGTPNALAIMPLHVLMQLLKEAKYTP